MTIVLHGYATSPFAELARVALGLKGLAYQAVEIPMIAPKPDLVALTGGYQRTPVLQVGADIYCDTAAICDALERVQPEPSLYPAPLGALHRMIANWAGGPQFFAHVGAMVGLMPKGTVPAPMVDDRRRRFNFDFEGLGPAEPHLRAQALTTAAWLETLLGDGRAFIGGDAAGHGDLALYSNLWFVWGRHPGFEAAAHPRLAAWYERVGGFGHGRPEAVTGAAAIEVARRAAPDLSEMVDAGGGFVAGQAVRVKTDGSGDESVAGRLLRLSPAGIAVAVEIPGGGTAAVNFPRLGQTVLPA